MRSKQRITERNTCNWASYNGVVDVILICKIDRVLPLLIVISYVSWWLLLLDYSFSISLWILSPIVIRNNKRFSLALNQLVLPWSKIGLSIWRLFGVEKTILLYHSGILLLWWSGFKCTSEVVLIMCRHLLRVIVTFFHMSIARSPCCYRPYISFKIVSYSLRCGLVCWRRNLICRRLTIGHFVLNIPFIRLRLFYITSNSWFQNFFRDSNCIWFIFLRIFSFVMTYKMLLLLFYRLFLFIPILISLVNGWRPFILLLNHMWCISNLCCFGSINLRWSVRRE